MVSKSGLFPRNVSPDGKHVLILEATARISGPDISVIRPRRWPPGQAVPPHRVSGGGGHFSPDGRWVAYHSDESDEFEVYVTPFPGRVAGGRCPRPAAPIRSGTADGSQIVFTRMNGILMSARVRADGETFEVLGEDELFSMRPPEGEAAYFSITSDADRVLIIPGTSESRRLAAPPAGELANGPKGTPMIGSDARSVQGDCRARRRRHGSGVAGRGLQARPRGGAQGAAGGVREGPGADGADSSARRRCWRA